MSKTPKKPQEEEKEEPKRLLFDSSHGEVLDITSDEYKPLRDFLKQNNYEVYKLSQSPITADLIEEYTIFIIGAPVKSRFSEEEITELMKYLREGGALFLIHQAGGDNYNNTNLNDIAKHLGYEFNSDYLAHEIDYEGDDYYQTISKGIALDPLTMGVRAVYTGNTCTIKINDPSGAKSLIFSHEPWPESRHLAVYGYYSLGRHLGMCLDIIKNIKRYDNSFFIQSGLYWLGTLRTEKDFMV
ncbi:MAG: hypothetical protein ACTSVV_10870 [Promethearchaeota archaeon]